MKIKVGNRKVDATTLKFKTSFYDNYLIFSRAYFNKKQIKMFGLNEGDLITVFFMKNDKTLLSYNFIVKKEDRGLLYIEIPALLTNFLQLGTLHKKAVAFKTEYGLVFVLMGGESK